MYRILALLVAALAACSLGFAASSSTDSDEQALTQIESDWATALTKVDFTVIDRVTAPDWMLTTPDGMLLTKAQADADLKSGTVKFQSFKTDELKVRVNGDTAVVFGLETEKSSYKGEDMSAQYRFTDVFVKRGGKWVCLATHSSKVVPKAAKM